MRNLFSTRVKIILVVAVLLTAILAVLSGITNTTVVDLAVQGVLAPFRAAATALTRATSSKGVFPGSMASSISATRMVKGM